MSAITLSELTRAGIKATVEDGRLRLTAPPAKLTAHMRERIAASRDALLRELTPAGGIIRSHLLKLAIDEGVPADLVNSMDDADVLACHGHTDYALRGYLRTLAAQRRMDAGLPLLEWGEPVARTCEGCGPVLLWPGCPDLVKACPWCFRRKAGKCIARPEEPPVAHWAREDAEGTGGSPYFLPKE